MMWCRRASVGAQTVTSHLTGQIVEGNEQPSAPATRARLSPSADETPLFPAQHIPQFQSPALQSIAYLADFPAVRADSSFSLVLPWLGADVGCSRSCTVEGQISLLRQLYCTKGNRSQLTTNEIAQLDCFDCPAHGEEEEEEDDCAICLERMQGGDRVGSQPLLSVSSLFSAASAVLMCSVCQCGVCGMAWSLTLSVCVCVCMVSAVCVCSCVRCRALAAIASTPRASSSGSSTATARARATSSTSPQRCGTRADRTRSSRAPRQSASARSLAQRQRRQRTPPASRSLPRASTTRSCCGPSRWRSRSASRAERGRRAEEEGSALLLRGSQSVWGRCTDRGGATQCETPVWGVGAVMTSGLVEVCWNKTHSSRPAVRFSLAPSLPRPRGPRSGVCSLRGQLPARLSLAPYLAPPSLAPHFLSPPPSE